MLTRELEPVISHRQLCARYGWKDQTGRVNRVKGRTPPFLKVGARILFLVRDVEEWERARRFQHTAEMSETFRREREQPAETPETVRRGLSAAVEETRHD